jgi:hypothetical protein
MNGIAPTQITPADARWSVWLSERMGGAVPAQLTTLGNLTLLGLPKTGLFCFARCPGATILRVYDEG